ncbi:MAG: peroxidase family protein [Crocosphaera sp.]
MNQKNLISSVVSQWSLILTGATLLSCAWSLPANAGSFRSINGSNNNLAHPTWGEAGIDLLRLAEPAYEDSISQPRGGNPSSLPSVRAISKAMSAQSGSVLNSSRLSDWVWQWGQFVDHDLDLTPIGESEAFNIPVPTGDQFFDPSARGNQVIDLNRSEFHTDTNSVRQQFNEITAYIDASNIYGSDASRTVALRTNDGRGKLIAETAVNGEKLLMFNTIGLPNDTGGNPNSSDFFVSGDVRANEQVGLLASHSLFMREHNRIADDLKNRLDNGEVALIAKRDAAIADGNNGVDNEGDFIFESARKVVGAQMQMITYNEWLPLIVGDEALEDYNGYDDTVNASVSTEFSTAAFRFGHTMLSPDLLRVNNNGKVVESLSLRDSFFNPQEVLEDGVNTLFMGLASQEAQAVDTLLVDDVRNFLFGPPGAGGFDLASLNMQRGRDHGIPDINTVRLALQLPVYNSFLELTGGDVTLANTLATVYENNLNVVDLWIGGLAEQAVNGGLLGETFSTIVVDQFTRSRDGDRFFYLNDLEHLMILAPDLQAVSLSTIIRRNSNLSNIQENVFLVPSVQEPKTTGGLILLGLLFGCKPSRKAIAFLLKE